MTVPTHVAIIISVCPADIREAAHAEAPGSSLVRSPR